MGGGEGCQWILGASQFPASSLSRLLRNNMCCIESHGVRYEEWSRVFEGLVVRPSALTC